VRHKTAGSIIEKEKAMLKKGKLSFCPLIRNVSRKIRDLILSDSEYLVLIILYLIKQLFVILPKKDASY